MTFIYELDSYPLNMYAQTTNELSTSRLSKVTNHITYIQTDTQTDRQTDRQLQTDATDTITTLRGW